MNATWFRRYGRVYAPLCMVSIIITLLAIVFLIPIFTAITCNGHSVSDDLYPHVCLYYLQCFLAEMGC
jgi:hypothetical protein